MPSGIYKRTNEHRRKLSLSHKGKIPKNLSWLHKHTKGKKRLDITGENHWFWKKTGVSYRTLHKWVERKLGKANHCEKNKNHISTRYHWANISKEYKRDLNDWTQLCPSCNCKDRIGRRVAP